MSVTFRAGTGGFSNATSLTIATSFPTGTTTGDLAFIFCNHGNADVTYQTPAGWTLAVQHSNILWSNINSAVFYRVIQAGDTAPTITFSTAGGGVADKYSWAAVAFRPGAGGVLSVDNVGDPGLFTDQGTSKAINARTAVASEVASVVFAGNRAIGTGAVGISTTPPANWTEAVDVSTNAGTSVGQEQIGSEIFYRAVQTGTIAPGNYTLAINCSANVWHYLIKETGGGGTTQLGGGTLAATATSTATATVDRTVGATGGLTGTGTAGTTGAKIQTAAAALTIGAPLGTLRGVNSSGGEFAGGTIPGTPDVDYHYDSAASLTYLASRGHKHVRLPFLWERIQPTLGAALATAELGRLQAFIANAGTAGLGVILDVHNYGGYNGVKIGDAGGPTQAQFADLWTRLSTAFKADTRVIAYGLMNEPNGLPAPPLNQTNRVSTNFANWFADDGAPTILATTFQTRAALRVTRTGSAFNGASATANVTVTAGETVTMAADVWPATASGRSRIRLEWRDAGNSILSSANSPNNTIPTGAWYHHQMDVVVPAGATQAKFTVFMDDQNTAGDNFYISAPYVASPSPRTWHSASQAAVTAIRGNADTKRILVPGDTWSGVADWTANNGTAGWITDSAGNFLYEGHHYFDRDHSGTYTNTYPAEVTDSGAIGWTAGPYADALTNRVLSELANWRAWLVANGASGYVGEFGWPRNNGAHTTDYPSWNTLGGAWLSAAGGYGIGWSYWSTSEWWGTYSLSLYDTSGGVLAVPNSQAATVESFTGGAGWTASVSRVAAGAAALAATAVTSASASTITIASVGNAMPFGRNTVGRRGVLDLLVRIGRGVASRPVTVPLPDDAEITWSVPGGDDTFSCTVDWPDRGIARPDAFQQNMPVRVEDRRNGEIIWQGRIADPGFSGDRARQQFRINAVGSGHDLDMISTIKNYVDRDPEHWFDTGNWPSGVASRGDGTGFLPSVHDSLQILPEYYIELPWPSNTFMASGAVQAVSYWIALYTGRDMLVTDGASTSAGTAATVPEAHGIRYSWMTDFANANEVRLIGASPDTGSSVQLLAQSWTSNGVQNNVSARDGISAWTRDDFTHFQISNVRTGGNITSSGGDGWLRIANIHVLGKRYNRYGTDVTGNRIEALAPYEIFEDLLGTVLNGRFDPGTITPDGSILIDQAAWWEATPVSDILEAANGWNNDAWWGVWAPANPDALPRLDYRAWNVRSRYTLDDTATVTLAGGAEGWANSALITYTRGNGVPTTTRGTITVPAIGRIFGSSGVGTLATRTRDLSIDLTDRGAMTRTKALEIAGNMLQASATDRLSGSTVIRGPIIDDLTGRLVQPWEIRPGWPIIVGSTPNQFTSGGPTVFDGESTFRLSKVSYRASDDTSTLELNGGTRRLVRGGPVRNRPQYTYVPWASRARRKK